MVILVMCMHVCLCGAMFTRVQVSQRLEEDAEPPGTGGAGCHELPDIVLGTKLGSSRRASSLHVEPCFQSLIRKFSL